MWRFPQTSHEGDVPAHPIVRPGTSRWKEAIAVAVPTGRTIGHSVIALAMLSVIAMVASVLIVNGPAALGYVLMASVFVLPMIGWAVCQRHVVGPPSWRYEGVSIDGEALALLADIQGRFDYAHRLIDDVPTGMDWADVAPHSEQLLWDAAGHAARVSALDVEIGNFRYAASGTPQMALKKALEERRLEHWDSMRRIQTEADSLARAAGNAAAAAKIALARTGSLRALEVVAPSARSILAFDALSEARARLQLLADVWTELDESTLILQEKLEAERLSQDDSGSTPTTS